MAILIACEWSQEVTRAFRDEGVEAYSCDIEEPALNPKWHIRDDVRNHLGNKWDAIIAFPPCTHLSSSGARWFKEKQKDGRQQAAIDFFMLFANHPAPFIVIENPVGIMSTHWRKPDQTIQPYEYGHPESKRTCLWLRGLPLLEPTNILQPPPSGKWENQTPSGQNKLGPSPDRARLRGKTYTGIAEAMAKQWGKIIKKEK